MDESAHGRRCSYLTNHQRLEHGYLILYFQKISFTKKFCQRHHVHDHQRLEHGYLSQNIFKRYPSQIRLHQRHHVHDHQGLEHGYLSQNIFKRYPSQNCVQQYYHVHNHQRLKHGYPSKHSFHNHSQKMSNIIIIMFMIIVMTVAVSGYVGQCRAAASQ